MESLLHQLQQLTHWQIDLLVIWLLLQGAILTIFPEEVIMLALGMAWSQGRVGFFEAWLAVTIGLLPANAFIFSLSKYIGKGALKRKPFVWFVNADKVEASLEKVIKRRFWIVFVTRFTPYVRAPIYIACGLSPLKLRQFSSVDFLASLIHIPLLILLGGAIKRATIH